MGGAGGEADDLEAFEVLPAHPACGELARVVEHGQLDVLEGGGSGEEVGAREDESELLAADVGTLVAVEAAELVHQRGLAGSPGRTQVEA